MMAPAKGTSNFKGKKHTEEYKILMKDKMKNRPITWRDKIIKTRRENISSGRVVYPKGDRAYHWKGGPIGIINQIKLSEEYKQFRMDVLLRDNFTCQNCGIRGYVLEVHHIKQVKFYPELILDINNGVTLCKKCHDLTKQGRPNNI